MCLWDSMSFENVVLFAYIILWGLCGFVVYWWFFYCSFLWFEIYFLLMICNIFSMFIFIICNVFSTQIFLHFTVLVLNILYSLLHIEKCWSVLWIYFNYLHFTWLHRGLKYIMIIFLLHFWSFGVDVTPPPHPKKQHF